MTILSALKEGTRPLHDKLEGELDLLRSDFKIEDYINVLKKFYGFYLPLESKLSLPVERLKVIHLESDLEYFHVNLRDIALCPEIPLISSPSDLYGVRYVLEGSTLGGQILRKHFGEKFNLTEGLSFFSGYGTETVPKWREFQNELLTFSESKSFDRERLLASANTTFRLLNDWLIKRI